ncbi:MAG: DUF1579 family protein [Armatimonadetes bacterium]|nr:DUF1579 domain-containing protein [Armatimonadota bacterium]MBS1702037.1 DUF1579 family protein [Armatimonadota bacterium]
MSFIPVFACLCAVQAPPETQFDFWVGTWNLDIETRRDPSVKEWTKTKGKNVIEKILDGKVVQENFSGGALTGKSWSVYSPATKSWRQTWVDNSSGYIVLNGKWEDDKMVLYDQPPQGAKHHRMIYQDVKKDSFEWLWEVEAGDGKWEPVFKCHYHRAS